MVLLRDIGKLAIAALGAGVVAALVRPMLAPSGYLVVLAGCGAVFAGVYCALGARLSDLLGAKLLRRE